MSATTLLESWRHQPAMLMGGLGLLSGILSATFGMEFQLDALRPVGAVFFLEPGSIPIGLFFGAVVAIGVWMATGATWAPPVLLLTTMYAWSAAIHTAIRLQTNRGEHWRLILASLAAGAVGALITHAGCALFSRELRRPWRVAATVAVGAVLGVLFYLGEQKVIDERLLFIVWQPAVAFCIGLGLAQHSAGR